MHRGQLGTLCASCHVADDWKIIHTGHDVPTPKFARRARSRAVRDVPPGRASCSAARATCASRAIATTTSTTTRSGRNCGECHTQRTWAGAHFEHNRVGCELIGVHRMLPCVDCHVGGNFTALAPNCAACHRKDAIRGARVRSPMGGDGAPARRHARGFDDCAGCHNPIFFGPSDEGSAPGVRESVCR